MTAMEIILTALSSDSVASYRERYIDLDPKKAEHIARERRLAAFRKSGNVTEVLKMTQRHKQILDFLPMGCRDHWSCWVYDGFPLIMTEPYHRTLADFSDTELAVVEIPEAISPYGGFWNPKPNASPKTRSFLLTSRVYAKKLKRLHDALIDAAKTMPPWNALEE
jgi:hypothetical protein